MKHKKLFLTLGIILVAAGLGWKIHRDQQRAQQKEHTQVINKQDLKETLTLSGTVDAQEKASLRFQTSGMLAWVGVKEGDAVKKYQTIASLDQRQVKKTLEKQLNDYLKDRWDLEQTRDDKKTTADIGETQKIRDAAKRILDKSQFDLNSSVLDVELQQLTIDFTYLWSPINGILTHIDTPYAGVNITPAGAEFDVVNPNTAYLSVLADQTEVTKLTASMSGELIFDAYPQDKTTGIITSLAFSPKSGETGTVYEAKLSIPGDNTTYKYRLGMTADATFTIRSKPDSIAIPTTALKQENGTTFVWVKRRGQKVKQIIVTGDEFGNQTEVTSGLSVGEVVYD